MAGKVKRKPRYSVGEANKLIDAVLHPLAKGNVEVPVLLFDSLLHGIVEQNPKESVRKFVRYNVPKLIKKGLEGR